jgi:hypothetical protein
MSYPNFDIVDFLNVSALWFTNFYCIFPSRGLIKEVFASFHVVELLLKNT